VAVGRREGTDAIVVGAGAIGTLTALRLQQAGVHVVLFAPADVMGEASHAAGAMLGTFGEVVSTTLTTDEGRARFELDRRATRRWDVQLEEMGAAVGKPSDFWVVADQTVVIHNTAGSPDVDDRNFAAIVAALDTYGGTSHETEPGELGLRARQASRPLRAITIEGERAIDPRSWISDARQAFLSAGGRIVTARADGLLSSHGTVTGVRDVHGQTYTADWVVTCAGAFTSPLLASVPELDEAIMPVFSGAGVAAHVVDGPQTLPPRSVLRTPNRAFACGLHAVPRHGGGMYVGATNHLFASPVSAPTVDDAVFLLNCAVEQLHAGFSRGRIAELISGNRPVSADALPLIGRAPVPGLVVIAGTYREGIHLSPMIADHVRDIVTGAAEDPLWEPFRPDRAPVSAARDTVIERTVEHAVAVGDEYGWDVPLSVRDDLAASYRAHFTRVLDWLGVEAVPPPEILVELHRAPEMVRALRAHDKRRTRVASH